MIANVSYVWDPQGGTDTRSIKLRVTWNRDHRYFSIPSKTKMTKEEFEQQRKKDVKEAIRIAEGAKHKALEICDELGNNFTFLEFKLRYNNIVKGRNLPIASSQHTVQNLFEEFIHTRTLKPNTIIIYKAAIHHVLRVRPNALITDVTPTFITEMIKEMKADEFNRSGKEMSINTIGIHLRSLKAIFQLAVDRRYIDTNPVHGIKIPHAQRQRRALREDEWNAFKAYSPIEGTNEEFAYDMAMLTFAMCGANMADILRLKNCNIHSDRIHLIRQKTEKVDTEIILPMNAEAMRIMAKYGSINPETPNAYVLPFYRGAVTEELRNMRRDAVLKKVNAGLRSICNEIGIEPFTTYNMRHTFAIMGTQNGNIGLSTMSRLLGHTTTATTDIYLSGITTTSLNKTGDFITRMLA